VSVNSKAAAIDDVISAKFLSYIHCCFNIKTGIPEKKLVNDILCRRLRVLFDDQLNDECKKFLAYIQEEVQRMNRLIEGIMTFSKRSC
jgi:hypothetical protein